ncbi:hypothetical protein MFUL124B02_25795 [Myxococcus fulvus 124B02]|nr:hypothetical protein MFUL124B02_25795 [Myxococcus fulvus 124B02]
MAAKRKTKAREAQLAFEALSIEGGLLSPEWLSKVAQLQAGTQAEADYRIHKGLNLRDEIGRYWRIAQAHWADFKSGREAKADPKATAERFVLALLRDAFGFTALAPVGPAVLQERTYPIGYATLAGRVPVVVAPADSGLDTLSPAFGDGARRRSAFGLAQEYLNAQEGALWGIASDGVALRIVRDNASLTRPAWIEADLQRIFTEDRYADFAALWLLCHETRFGREGQPVTECALEVWRSAGREEGTRAREHLRRGVEEALVALGQGFLSHAENAALRADLQNGTLPVKDYFNQLLRLVYRLIFLLTVEERGLLHPDGTSDATKALYANGYGIRRLRERSVKRSAHDRFSDLWEATKVVCRGLAAGEPRLGLPALAGIFAPNQCSALDGAKLENRAMLLAVFKLAWLREDGSLSRVNWRDMGPEELGSVYESLLELVPQIAKDGRQFAFATGGETKGNARKTTGSYYTPDSLVQVLLDSALEPVIADTIAKNPGNAVEALLGLSIVDPACGSGHFLLAAARRLAAHVARLQANGTPSAAEYRHALRQVVGRCIFGVDLNQMAVELCKVGLWMEAVEPGLPLTFLNSHIQHGNALLGTTPELMAKGILDAAWDPIEGDDKKTASALKKRNKKAAEGQRSLDTLWTKPVDTEAQTVTRAVTELDAASDANVEALARKEERWDGILGSPEYRHQKFVADAWCAAFVWPKQPGELTDAAPTNELWRQLRDGQGKAPALTTKTVGELADQYRFFHWHLQFPQVFAKGGFDVVLGNPPWDSLLFREEEFFAGPRPDIVQASTAAARKKLIAKLETDDPVLFAAYRSGLREVDGTNAFVRSGVRYPLCGVGRVNLFALFAEAARSLVSKRGRVGQILPSGIVSDDSTKLFFQDVIEKRQLVSFFDFENREGIFSAVHRSFKLGIITLAGERPLDTEAEFVFFATRVDHIKDAERRFSLSADDIALLNPTTKTCPIFRSRRDAELTKAIYRTVPVLTESGWNLTLRRLLNSADDSGSFLDAPGDDRLPLYEGKYFHHYEHRWVTTDDGRERPLNEAERVDPSVFTQTRHWYPAADALARFGIDWMHSWVFAWRDIARSTDERTFIAAIVPSLAVPHTAKVIFVPDGHLPLVSAFVACVGSFPFDFIARQKTGGTHMSGFIVEQLPVLVPAKYQSDATWSPGTTLREWLTSRVLELTYTAWDLEPFARDVGHAGTPFRWDPERRFQLRCELDAAFFHLYGLARDDVDYVMETFPIVRKNDEKAHGEYRTKRVILETYDSLAKASQTGKPYRTRLDPLPAAPGASHYAFAPDGTPKDYAEALRTGLLFTLIRRTGEAGISQGTLSRALLWLQDAKHAASWLEGSALADFERVRESDPLLAQGTSQAPQLLDALENEKAITRDAKGIVRLRAGSAIPNWLPQTPTLTKLASVMRAGLERAEDRAATTPAIEKPAGKVKHA